MFGVRSVARPTVVAASRPASFARPQTTVRHSSSLRAKLEKLIPEKQAEVKEIKAKYGNEVLGQHTVAQAYGGMRGITGLVTETSLLDAEEGIRFRGLSIPECQEQLPKAPGGEEPIPEGLLWLLFTGEVPTQAECDELSAFLMQNADVSSSVKSLIDSYPKDMHPMTQFASAVLALQPESEFAAKYAEGIHKSQYWEPALNDSLQLIAKLPTIAARIYRNVYSKGAAIDPDTSLDWGANYAKMMGFDEPQFLELVRLYLTIHSDHEGGNVSAHATHLVGSALSDPYLSFAAGMAGLAGPLHGLANQEVLRWTTNLKEKLGPGDHADSVIEQAIWDTLNSGQVVPGFGHAVLRKTDPRYTCQREFAMKHLPDDPLFKLVSQLYTVVPKVLTEQGKVSNPWPNVDAHSGCLLQYYGLKEDSYYTVMFGVSRALGVLPSLVWDRALGQPIERPKSVTSEWIAKKFGGN